MDFRFNVSLHVQFVEQPGRFPFVNARAGKHVSQNHGKDTRYKSDVIDHGSYGRTHYSGDQDGGILYEA